MDQQFPRELGERLVDREELHAENSVSMYRVTLDWVTNFEYALSMEELSRCMARTLRGTRIEPRIEPSPKLFELVSFERLLVKILDESKASSTKVAMFHTWASCGAL
jgi:hypothetical protein